MFLSGLIFNLLLFLAIVPTIATGDEVQDSYTAIVEREQASLRKNEVAEDLASGAAALVIGFYGYYNSQLGIATKLAYGATQTVGVLMLSSALGRMDKPNIVLRLDQALQSGQTLDLRAYQQLLVGTEQARIRAEQRQIAYTSLILASIYGYNAFREQEVLGLRNVFAFLSLNFLVVSGVNFIGLSQSLPALSLVPTEGSQKQDPSLSLQAAWTREF